LMAKASSPSGCAAVSVLCASQFGGSMSYVYLSRHTEEEYQRYTPKENRRVEIVRKTAVFFGLAWIAELAVVIGLAYAGFAADDIIQPWVVWSFVILFVVSIILATWYYAKLAGLDALVDDALQKERDALHTQVAKMENDIKSVADRVRDIKATGHVVMAGDGTTVIIGSDVSNSFNVVRNTDPALADALQTISGAVEKSGNKDAGQAWERFIKQALGERDKTVLSALWDRVVKLVPDVTKLVESVAKIAALFA
jgi:hypothetical protein